MRRPLAVFACALLLTGCSSSGAPAAQDPLPSPGPTGSETREDLLALLLQPADLPELVGRREFASPELTTQATPQLGLCRPVVADAPHQLTNVLAKPARTGEATVFQIVAVYADEVAARAAFARDVAAARACTSYRSAGQEFRVEDLEAVTAPADARIAHYRLTTDSTEDARTFAQRGRYTVLVTGTGIPPRGLSMLTYQEAAMRAALTRLPAR